MYAQCMKKPKPHIERSASARACKKDSDLTDDPFAGPSSTLMPTQAPQTESARPDQSSRTAGRVRQIEQTTLTHGSSKSFSSGCTRRVCGGTRTKNTPIFDLKMSQRLACPLGCRATGRPPTLNLSRPKSWDGGKEPRSVGWAPAVPVLCPKPSCQRAPTGNALMRATTRVIVSGPNNGWRPIEIRLRQVYRATRRLQAGRARDARSGSVHPSSAHTSGAVSITVIAASARLAACSPARRLACACCVVADGIERRRPVIRLGVLQQARRRRDVGRDQKHVAQVAINALPRKLSCDESHALPRDRSTHRRFFS